MGKNQFKRKSLLHRSLLFLPVVGGASITFFSKVSFILWRGYVCICLLSDLNITLTTFFIVFKFALVTLLRKGLGNLDCSPVSSLLKEYVSP